MTIGIYKIEALCPVAKLAGRAIYIGQSKNIERRWKAHHKRFPPDQYDYMVILACEPESLNLLEKLFIDVYDSHKNGLNKTIGGTDIKARYPDEETRSKISEAHKGRVFSEEHKQKLSRANKGKTLTAETRAKIGQASKGRKMPPRSSEYKAKMSASNRRRTVSAETRAKLSEAKKGKPMSEELKRKLLEVNRGRATSEETKRKQSEAQKERHRRRREESISLSGCEEAG